MIALLLAAVLSLPYPRPSDLGDIVPVDNCAQLYKDPKACNNWKLATWLPEIGPALGLTKNAATVVFTDGFLFDRRSFDPRNRFDGTSFVDGKAGKPGGEAFYDALHRIAFYYQFCCAWSRAVLAAGVGPPPLTVANRILTSARTQRGLRLGMTTSEALQIYGGSRPEASASIPGVEVRSYRHPMPPPSSPTCEQDMALGFYRDRLIYIGITNAC